LVKQFRSTLRSEHRNFFTEPKSITSAGIAFHTFITRSVKKWALAVVEKCGLYNLIYMDDHGWKCNEYKNSSGDEIANVNFLRRYGTYVLQNTKKENLLRLTN